MRKRILLDTLKKDKNLLLLFGVMTAANLAVFLLYRIMTEAFFYAEAVILVFVILFVLLDYMRNLKKAYGLENAVQSVKNGNCELLPADTFEEVKYSEMIDFLTNKINEMSLSFSEEKQDLSDWYTIWVHQIKTPIAVLKLKVPESDKEIRNELFRIEEYADMALSYIRLGSEQNDLVIKEYPLDELIRETLRKYASQFIAKKIKLEYSPTEKTVITDKKWMLCILEQFISNAVKYTDSGTVTVEVCGDMLTVSDTGIGIGKADLPRIFEKSYTGNNGRADAKSSGLGLYLSKKAANMIGVTLSVDSTLGYGSRFSITFTSLEQPVLPPGTDI